MTTLKGALRPTVKRTERARQKHVRDVVQHYRKQQDIQRHNEYMEVLRSLHKDCSESVDWNEIRKMPPPLEEPAENKREKQARQKLLSWSPSLLDKLFNTKEKKIRELTLALENAILADKTAHENYLLEYTSALADWHRL